MRTQTNPTETGRPILTCICITRARQVPVHPATIPLAISQRCRHIATNWLWLSLWLFSLTTLAQNGPSYSQRMTSSQGDHVTNRMFVAGRMASAPPTASLTSPTVSSAVTASGTIVINVPTDYSISLNNSLTSIDVPGNSTAPVQSHEWQLRNDMPRQQLSLSINGGELVGTSNSRSVGFAINPTTLTTSNPSNSILNIANDGEGSYAVDRLINVFAASSVVRKSVNR